MKLPDHIEKKLRDIARKKGMSEVEYVHYRELRIKLATLKAGIIKEMIREKAQKAA